MSRRVHVNITERRVEYGEEIYVVNGIECSVSKARQVAGEHLNPDLVAGWTDIQFSDFLNGMGKEIFTLVSNVDKLQLIVAMKIVHDRQQQ